MLRFESMTFSGHVDKVRPVSLIYLVVISHKTPEDFCSRINLQFRMGNSSAFMIKTFYIEVILQAAEEITSSVL